MSCLLNIRWCPHKGVSLDLPVGNCDTILLISGVRQEQLTCQAMSDNYKAVYLFWCGLVYQQVICSLIPVTSPVIMPLFNDNALSLFFFTYLSPLGLLVTV